MERQDDTPDPSLEVVAEERGRAQVALPLEDHVVEHVVEVDQEAPGEKTGGQGRASRAGIHGGPGHGRGDEMSAGAHATLLRISMWGKRAWLLPGAPHARSPAGRLLPFSSCGRSLQEPLRRFDGIVLATPHTRRCDEDGESGEVRNCEAEDS